VFFSQRPTKRILKQVVAEAAEENDAEHWVGL
jgi:hypothetical protein